MHAIDPTTLGLPDTLSEDVNRRTANSMQFQQRSNSRRKTSLLVSNLFYEQRAGEWEPQELNYRLEGANHVSDRGSYHSRVTDEGVELTDPGTGVGVRWNLPARAGVSGELSTLSGDGVVWQYRKGPKRLKLTGTVAVPIGLRTFRFPYTPLGAGASFTLVNGQAVVPGLIVPAPLVIGANRVIYQSSGWRLATGRLELVFDDSLLPPEAYPYIVDPTTVVFQQGIDSYSGCIDTYIDSVNASSNSGNLDYLRQGDPDNANIDATKALVKWDISSIDTDQVVTDAKVELYHNEGGSNVSGLTSWDCKMHKLLKNWVELEATWELPATGSDWGTDGAINVSDDPDRTTDPSATTNIPSGGSTAYLEWSGEDVITDVGNFVSSPSTNYGWLFESPAADNHTGYAYTGFATTEFTTSLRPKLTVDHEDPTPPATSSIAGAQPTSAGVISDIPLKNLAGAQPTSTGAQGAVKYFTAEVGNQPTSTSTLAVIYSIALAGSQPTSTGAISDQSIHSDTGAQPTSTGALSFKYIISLAGNQPTLTGALSTQYQIALVGNQPNATGALTKTYLISLAGSQPTATGILSALYLMVLTGSQPTSTGALAQKYLIALAGNQPTSTGTLAILSMIVLTGSQPTSTGAVSVNYIIALLGAQPTSTGALAVQFLIVLSGSQPTSTGAVAVQYQIVIVGNQPTMSSTLTTRLLITLNGNQPTMSGVLIIIGTGTATLTATKQGSAIITASLT